MAFTFHRQPFKAVYKATTVLYVLVSIPVWVLIAIVPAWRPRRSWTVGRTLTVKLIRTYITVMFNTDLPASPPPAIIAASPSAKEVGFAWVDPAPDLITGEIRDLAQANGVKAEKSCGYWYGPRGADGAPGQRASKGEKVILHMHGGGYVMGTSHPANTPMVACYNGFLEHFPKGMRIFGCDYRVASAAPFPPANPFPAALIDAVAAYRYLVEDVGFEPENIIIGGDSAGGALALALGRYLAINNFPNLRNAAGLLLLSPTADWAATHDEGDCAMKRNSPTDYVQAIVSSDYTRRALVGKLPADTAATNIWFSPGSRRLNNVQGAFASLPPVCMVTGGGEITLDPMRLLKDRLLEDMGEERVFYLEAPDASHDFFTAPWHEPERTDGLRKVAEWVRKVWGEGS
ncbi:hypothetical protein CERSUDRAFT_157056 [Gelatoporia subvermispora B]|uniref:Alpha/beta hydrolase fold-3 domain-containing protein n=1 Tax=Ceriporiopsis subvermispora (strain B) TaxID=914234 RepID=M2QE73_CERS8|nr:hypothetical protein CERSUDRAFT_157056 [Gelatoporia subvermispora B]